jgi:hypothetical protein
MPKIVLFAAIFLIGEAVAFFIFLLVKRKFEKKWQWCVDLQTIKGWLERLFLFLCLVYGLPHALIAFGAIKIGTRVNDKGNKISNDYFFIGNMVSLLLVVFFYAFWLLWKD